MLKRSLAMLAAIAAVSGPQPAVRAAEPPTPMSRAANQRETQQPAKQEATRPRIVIIPGRPVSPCALFPLSPEQREQVERELLGIERPRWD
jgi:hypothetical protein